MGGDADVADSFKGMATGHGFLVGLRGSLESRTIRFNPHRKTPRRFRTGRFAVRKRSTEDPLRSCDRFLRHSRHKTSIFLEYSGFRWRKSMERRLRQRRPLIRKDPLLYKSPSWGIGSVPTPRESCPDRHVAQVDDVTRLADLLGKLAKRRFGRDERLFERDEIRIVGPDFPNRVVPHFPDCGLSIAAIVGG